MTDIDRDLVENPPATATSDRYARLFDAHVRQSLKHFVNALPGRGLFSLFKPKLDLDVGQASNSFENAYRKLLTDTLVLLPDGDSPDKDPESSGFRPVVVFLTDSRDMIVPETFLKPERRIVEKGTERDAESIASCFPYELIATIDRVLVGSGLSAEQRKKVCEIACFPIAIDFDDNALDERIDGLSAAPVLCYRTGKGFLVLLPHAALQHEYVHGNLDEYFKQKYA